MASKNGHFEIVEILLQIGADTNAEDKVHEHFTPLHYAASYGHIEVTKLLIQFGANVFAKSMPGPII